MPHTNLILFSAILNRSLKRHGLHGNPGLATYGDGALVMSGKEGGALRVDASKTARVRFGMIEGKYGVFHLARVWPVGVARPIIVEPNKNEPGAVAQYGQAMRAFARDVAGCRRSSSIACWVWRSVLMLAGMFAEKSRWSPCLR